MIDVKDLCKDYGQVRALDKVSLNVAKGELFAFLGPNGAGKTTTIRILTGLTRLTAGEVRLNGIDVQRPGIESRRQCGLVSQAINLDRELTVLENLEIHGRLFRMPKAERRQRIDTLLGYVEMEDRKKTRVKNLSGGLKRRLMITRALLHDPAILFLDEPTVGLDAAIRRKIWALIKKIQKNGTTIFLTTHYIEEAEFLAQRVAFIDRGKIVVTDTPETLMAGQGAWAVDGLDDAGMNTKYFNDRKEAQGYVAGHSEGFTLRRVNLEDAFLALTGKKVK